MAELKDTAIRLYRKYIGSPTAAEDQAAGVRAVLSGDHAVAVAEAAITQSVVIGASQQVSDADLAWQSETSGDALDVFGKPVGTMEAEGARGALASAIGLSLAGRRATAFLDGQDIAGTQDLLYSAAGRHLPLVIHLTNRALTSHGGSAGSGHEGFHLSCESGCFTLFAANAQEAADFTVIARRVAEECLVPGLVVMDAEQTAWSAQDVHLLAPAQLQSFIGPADGIMTVPTEAQKLLFGTQRRRVPRWHDVDRPVLQGAHFDRNSFALGALGRQAFFDSYLTESLMGALERFGRLTGRHYETVSEYKLDNADTVFVVQGSAVETVKAAADYLADEKKARVGVLGVNSIRPLPGAAIVSALRGKRQVVVLERVQAPLGDDGPLTREIRSALKYSEQPLCHSVTYGLGGAPLRIADIALIPSRIDRHEASHFALGVDFTRPGESHPKREVLQDALERAYPGIENSGLRERERVNIPLPENALSFLVERKSGSSLAALIPEIGRHLHRLEEGAVRTRMGTTGSQWGKDTGDYLVYSSDALLDPGDDSSVDVLVITDRFAPVVVESACRLRQQGLVVLAGAPTSILSAEFLQEAASRRAKFFVAGADDSDRDSTSKVELALGTVFGALMMAGKVALKERKVLSAREEALGHFPEDVRHKLLAAFQTGLDHCAEMDMSAFANSAMPGPGHWDDEAPAMVRALGRTDDQYDSLPRLWDQVGVMYNDGEADHLTVDPYLATGTVAPLSSTFRNLSPTRSTIPVFDPETCTGCGKCWTACPDSAIGPVVMSPASLIDTGMRIANGDSIRQVSNQLATRMTGQARKGELASTAGDAFKTEFEWLKEKMSMTPEREEALSTAVNNMVDGLDKLPLAVTDTFFHDAEKVKKDSGELLSIAINPDVCKGCGICVEQCEPLALNFAEQNDERLRAAATLWELWAETPDTPSATIDRVIEAGSVDALAALNLSRYCLHAMAGGDNAEAGSGEKIALRMVLASTEFYQQPLLNKFAHDVKQTAEDLIHRIQTILASALPGENLELLDRVLNRASSPLPAPGALAREIENAIDERKVDAVGLRRLTRLAEDLTDLHKIITEGTQGLGRARLGLAITPGSVSNWAAEFPYNSFQAPVVVDMIGETPQMAAGLLEGHMRDTCESVAVMRKAQLELEQPAGMEFQRAALDRLEWKDLTDDERRLCPPLILVGNDEMLAGSGLSQVLWLLSSDLPIKIVAMADLDLGIAKEMGRPSALHHDPRTNLVLLALAARNAYVAQTSIGDFGHIQRSVAQALQYAGPALIRVHAPSPNRHGVATDSAIRQAQLACTSRAYPLVTYDPRIDGVHGTRISLAGNPDMEQPFASDTSGFVTPAHWALTEARFESEFEPMASEDTGVELDEYLELEGAARSGKTPMLTAGDEDSLKRYRIGPDLIGVIDEQRATWRVLQELAGVVTPFTDKVWEEAKEGVSASHASEMEALKSEYEQKIAELTESVQQEVAGRIRSQLISLVKLKSSDIQADVTSES